MSWSTLKKNVAWARWKTPTSQKSRLLIENICSNITKQGKNNHRSSHIPSRQNDFLLCNRLLQRVWSLDSNLWSNIFLLELFQRTSFIAIQAGKPDDALTANHSQMVNDGNDPQPSSMYQHLHMCLSNSGKHQEAQWLLKWRTSHQHELSQNQAFIIHDVFEGVQLATSNLLRDTYCYPSFAKKCICIGRTIGLIISTPTNSTKRPILQRYDIITALEGPNRLLEPMNLTVQVYARTGRLNKALSSIQQLLPRQELQGDIPIWESPSIS